MSAIVRVHAISAGVAYVYLAACAGCSEDVASSRVPYPLALACEVSSVDVVKKILVADGADVNERYLYGDTPLHAAARVGRADVVRLLLSFGADVNAVNERGDTALHVTSMMMRNEWTTRSGHSDVVRVLVRCGEIDVTIRNTQDKTAADIFLEMGRGELTDALSASATQ